MKFVKDVDKSGFVKDAQPIQDQLAEKLGPGAVNVLHLVRDVPVVGLILFAAGADFSKGRPKDVLLPGELMDRYRKPEQADLERLLVAFAPHWDRVKAANTIVPAGQVTPSGKVWTGEDNPNAGEFNDWIPQDEWTPGMKRVAEFAQKLATKLMNVNIDVRFCCTPHMIASASYGPGGPLTFNKLRLGNGFFEQGLSEKVVALIIHEFGHQYSSDHLSEEYYDALCKLGAKLYLTKSEL